MSDFTRPNSQWTDLPSPLSALTPWHFEYSEVGGIGYLTLVSGRRRRLGTNLVLSDEVESAEGTVQTWTLSEQVNGEVEAQVAYLQSIVYVSG
jgi:hypothetical protein